MIVIWLLFAWGPGAELSLAGALFLGGGVGGPHPWRLLLSLLIPSPLVSFLSLFLPHWPLSVAVVNDNIVISEQNVD